MKHFYCGVTIRVREKDAVKRYSMLRIFWKFRDWEEEEEEVAMVTPRPVRPSPIWRFSFGVYPKRKLTFLDNPIKHLVYKDAKGNAVYA